MVGYYLGSGVSLVESGVLSCFVCSSCLLLFVPDARGTAAPRPCSLSTVGSVVFYTTVFMICSFCCVILKKCEVKSVTLRNISFLF